MGQKQAKPEQNPGYAPYPDHSGQQQNFGKDDNFKVVNDNMIYLFGDEKHKIITFTPGDDQIRPFEFDVSIFKILSHGFGLWSEFHLTAYQPDRVLLFFSSSISRCLGN